MVENLLKKRRFPVVDKRLRLVIGIGSGCHEVLRAHLFAYHANQEYVESYERDSDAYIEQDMGYFVSGVREKGLLIVGKSYIPDRFDRDLFLVQPPSYF